MISQLLSSQDYIKQVLILNEGYFDYTSNQSIEPVTIGSYDPISQSYTIVDTILGARFASDLIVHQNYFYVAADNMLYKYNKDSYELLASQQIPGIRNLAVWNDKILVTRGNYDNITFQAIFYNSYFQVFNISDLSFYLEIDTITGPKWATQNLIVDGDKAYVAINNAYEFGNEKGIVGVIDMNTFSYLSEINLGLNGINPDNMMKEGNDLYTVNNKDWSGSSISKINTLTNSVQTINLSSVSTGCGTSCLRDGKINYQISSDTILYEWDIQTLPNSGNAIGFDNNFYDLSYDHINGMMYASSTDFFSYGNINIYNQNNFLVYSFECGISPGTITFDIVSMTNSINNVEFLNDKNQFIYDLSGRSINNQILHQGIHISNNKKIFICK